MRVLVLVGALLLVAGCTFQQEDVGGATAAVTITSSNCTIAGMGTLATGEAFAGLADTGTGWWQHFGPAVAGAGTCDDDDDDDHGDDDDDDGDHDDDDDGDHGDDDDDDGDHDGDDDGDHDDGDHDDGDDDDGACAPARDSMIGTVELTVCQSNGSIRGVLSGTCVWNGGNGHSFRVDIQDTRRTDIPDFYQLIVVAPDGSLAHISSGALQSGDFSVALR